jgi:hypothetical protein
MISPSKLPQDRSEHEQRELAKQRLQRFQASGSDAPAPVPEYERD